MTKYRKTTAKYRERQAPTDVVDAITFDELVEHGIAVGAPIHDGERMPWSFDYRECAITHENDDCYFVITNESMLRFDRGNVLVTDANGVVSVHSQDAFDLMYEVVHEGEPQVMNVAPNPHEPSTDDQAAADPIERLLIDVDLVDEEDEKPDTQLALRIWNGRGAVMQVTTHGLQLAVRLDNDAARSLITVLESAMPRIKASFASGGAPEEGVAEQQPDDVDHALLAARALVRRMAEPDIESIDARYAGLADQLVHALDNCCGNQTLDEYARLAIYDHLLTNFVVAAWNLLEYHEVASGQAPVRSEPTPEMIFDLKQLYLAERRMSFESWQSQATRIWRGQTLPDLPLLFAFFVELAPYFRVQNVPEVYATYLDRSK